MKYARIAAFVLLPFLAASCGPGGAESAKPTEQKMQETAWDDLSVQAVPATLAYVCQVWDEPVFADLSVRGPDEHTIGEQLYGFGQALVVLGEGDCTKSPVHKVYTVEKNLRNHTVLYFKGKNPPYNDFVASREFIDRLTNRK